MGKLPRKTVKRLWYAGLLVLWLLPFTLASIAQADNATIQAAGQGWAWKNRPTQAVPVTEPRPGTSVGGDIYCYEAPGGAPCTRQWQNDHIYVGWDGASNPPEPEAIGGITFDLQSIPTGSTIIRFLFTIKQHPSGQDHGNTPNHEAAKAHGIVACPWPESDLTGGNTRGPIFLDSSQKAERKCGQSISGDPPNATATALADPRKTFDWTFDLSTIASEWTSGITPAISIEPDPTNRSAVSFMTSFHYDTVLHYPPGHPNAGEVFDTTCNPELPRCPPPDPTINYVRGLYGEVTYLLPTGEEESGLVPGEFSSEFDSDSDVLAFGVSEGLAGDLGASSEPLGEAEPRDPNLAAGVFEGQPAGFWAYPLAWIAAILGFILLGFVGKVLQVDPGEGRPQGAAAALMRGASPSG